MQIIEWVQSFSNPFLDQFFIMITQFGEESLYVVLVTLIYWCIDKTYGYHLSFTLLFSSAINSSVKCIFKAPRPTAFDNLRHLRLETATGYSFPSGHTQTAATFFGFMMKKYDKVWLYVTGSILIFLVALSRLYLGVHWPEDVLAGTLLGIAISFFFAHLFRKSKVIKKKYLLLIIAVFTLCLLIFNTSSDLYKACGIFFSFLLGYSFEEKHIQFNPKTKLPKQIVKYISGIVVALVVKSQLKIIFPETVIFDFIRYFILGLWITLAAPYLFKVLGLSDDKIHEK